MKLLSIYVDSASRIHQKGHSLRRYIIDVAIVAGIPLEIFCAVAAACARWNIFTMKDLDGNIVDGTIAMQSFIYSACIHVPFVALSVGAALYLWNNKLKPRFLQDWTT